MQYQEFELLFNEPLNGQESHVKGIFNNKQDLFELSESIHAAPDLLGIRVRLGNRPLVVSLPRLIAESGGELNPLIKAAIADKDYYLVVHAIGVVRTQGKAKVDELQYFAQAESPQTLQTVDLIPNTRFKEVFHAGVHFQGALSASGQAMVEVPTEVLSTLLPQYLNIGANMQLQLSTSASFVGQFTYSIQLPVVTASGVASNSCTWILNPDEKKTPLLGDQLLVQSLAVPKGTTTIRYKVQGLVKVDRGIFWPQQQKATPEITVDIDLV